MKYSFLLIICLSLSFCTAPHKEEARKKIPKEQRVEAMAEQELLITKNPYTGKVHPENLEKIKENLKKQQPLKSSKQLAWEERGPNNFAGRVRAVLVDQRDAGLNTIFAGGIAGGLWKCTDAFGSYRWETIPGFDGNAAVSALVQDPIEPNILYLGTGEGWFNSDAYRGDGIYKSTDGGDNWERLTSTAPFTYVQDLKISNGRIFAATRTEGLQVSDNGGDTWRKSLGNGLYGFSERIADIEFGDNNVVFATAGFGGSQDGIYRSLDNGQSWEYLVLPFDDYSRIDLAVAPSNPSIVYGLVEDGEERGVKFIVKSEDGGDTWNTIDTPEAIGMDNFARKQAWYDLAIDIHPQNPDIVLIGAVDVLKTEDGGNTWDQVSQWYGGDGLQYIHADQHKIQFLDPTGSALLVSNDGGIYLTFDGNQRTPQFFDINNDFNITQFYSCSIHPDPLEEQFIGGTQDNGTHLFRSLGVNSTSEITGGDGAYCHIDKQDPDIQISSYVYNSYYFTTNGWDDYDYYDIGDREGFFINPTDFDDWNKILFCAAEDGSLNRVDIRSYSHDSLFLPIIANEKVTAIKVINDSEVMLGTQDGNILKLFNSTGAATAPVVFHNSRGSVRNFDVDPRNPSRMLATYSSYGVSSVFISTNEGLEWSDINGNLPDFPVRWGSFDPGGNGIILATELGVWTTDLVDGSNTIWTMNSDFLPMTRVDMLDIREQDNMMIAATHGRGIFSAQLLSDGSAAGDNCELSIRIPVGRECSPSRVNFTNANPSSDISGFNCGGSLTQNDVWLNAVVPFSGKIIIETSTFDNGPSDLLLEVYSDDCQNPILLACDDNSGTGNHASITLENQPAGERLLIRLGQSGNESEGFVGICAYDDTEVAADLCSSAIELQVTNECEPVIFSNENLSASGAFPNFICGEQGPGIDAWFKVVVPASGNLIVQTTRVDLSDMVMQIYRGSCGQLETIDCNDDDPVSTQSRLDLTDLVSGETIYMRVIEYQSDEFGEFGICVHSGSDTTEQPYDNCGIALGLTVRSSCNPQIVEYSTPTASISSGMQCGAFGVALDVWFEFTVPPSGHFIIETTSVTSGLTDMIMELYSGDCDNRQLLECNDDGGLGSHSRMEFSGRTPGETLYARVTEYESDETGVFGICVHDDQIVAIEADVCASSHTLTVKDSYQPDVYSNVGATASGTDPAVFCGDPGAAIDVWFTFDATATNLVVETSYSGGLIDLIMQVYTDDCNNLRSVACNDDFQNSFFPQITLTAEFIGQKFYARVIEFESDAEGEFNIGVYALVDADGDGFVSSEDCDDTNPDVNPGQAENPYNGLDDDCDPTTLDDDLDQDGFLMAEDCDDTNANINPDISETPYNGIDDDCDPATLDDDLDEDGFLLADDCNDEDKTINPDAEDIVNNGIDEDCDGMDAVSAVHELANSTVNIFPNPAIDLINIRVDGALDFTANLYSMEGKLVHSARNQGWIEVHTIAQGTYLLEIKDLNSGQRIAERIVIGR